MRSSYNNHILKSSICFTMQLVRCLNRQMLTAFAIGLLCAVVTASKQCRSEHDVCIVGAGGSGAFTAVKLKQKGYNVLVLEKDNRVSLSGSLWRIAMHPSLSSCTWVVGWRSTDNGGADLLPGSVPLTVSVVSYAGRGSM
jgi:hypothetical protein